MRGDKDRMEARLARAVRDGQAKTREAETAQHALQMLTDDFVAHEATLRPLILTLTPTPSNPLTL